MTDRTSDHYATLLAPIYRWMLGDLSSATERARAELHVLGVGRAGRPHSRALDLGAGLGLHAVPLATLGYEVTAIDSSATLLAQLSAACPGARVVQADLADLTELTAGAFEVVLCMGDTLTHLRSDDEARAVLAAASARVAPGGLFATTFRDYTGPPRRSTDRFILVRADAERILTCCLDYGGDRVTVTDVVHELVEGRWSMRASAYEKLRLAPSFVATELERHGLVVSHCESVEGRVSIVARRDEA